MRYDLPDRRGDDGLRSLIPLLVMLAVLSAVFFGSVYALAMAVDTICTIIEGLA